MTSMDDKLRNYLADHHAAAMITLRPDGTPHAVRCGIALVDGVLWSSGTRGRRRNEYLRRDPRCTLFVFGADASDPYSYLTLETKVRILDGDDAPEQNRRLFTEMQRGLNPPAGSLFWNGKPLSYEEFVATMAEEQRLIYEFEITGSYGLY
jgi:hypothetical protein